MFLPCLDILCFDRMILGEVNVAMMLAMAGHVGIGHLVATTGDCLIWRAGDERA